MTRRWNPAPTTEEQAALTAQIRAERDRACIEGIAKLAEAGAFDLTPMQERVARLRAARSPRRPRRATR